MKNSLSLEDDLMRIFGSESMNNILQKLGLKDGESIDHPWINKALERAQQKVEARNFDIRKTLIKFDNVLNDQRHVVFSQRKNAMNSENIFDYSDEFLKEIIQSQKNTSIKLLEADESSVDEFINDNNFLKGPHNSINTSIAITIAKKLNIQESQIKSAWERIYIFMII